MIGVIGSTDFPTMTVSDPMYNGGRCDALAFAVNIGGANSFD